MNAIKSKKRIQKKKKKKKRREFSKLPDQNKTDIYL